MDLSPQLPPSSVFISKDKLKAFLYILMRDTLPAGPVYSMAETIKDIRVSSAFSNDPLAKYAEQLILRFFLNIDAEVESDGIEEGIVSDEPKVQ